MTVTQILVSIAPYKEMSHATLYKHLRELRIKPVGAVRQIPQQYPEDTPTRVLKRLGITPKRNNHRHGSKLVNA